MPPEGCLLTLRFRLWCWSSVKRSQTIYFVTKVSSNGKVPFFFLLFTVLKKKIVSSGSIFFPELLVPKQSIPLRLKWPMRTFLEWNLFSFNLEMIFSHIQFIVIIFTQKHIDKLSKGKLGPKCFDFIIVESFDWPEVTFYWTAIAHRISLAYIFLLFFFFGTWKNISTHENVWLTLILWVLPGVGSPSLLVLPLRLKAGKVWVLPGVSAITGFHPIAKPLLRPSQPPPRAYSFQLGGLIRVHEVLQQWPGLRDNLSKYLSFLIFLNMLQNLQAPVPAVREVVT